MKYLLVHFITIIASVVVPQANSGKIYFPDEYPKHYVPNTENRRNNNGNTFWTGQLRNAWNQGSPNGGDRCVLTSLPPVPQSGCCGREASEDDKIPVNNYDPSGRTNRGPVRPPPRFFPPWMLRDLDDPATKNNTAVTIDNRISGGVETGLSQYPWTVHLLSTFGYQNKPDASFNCGGALISAKYVLSAAHCVTEPGGVLKSLTVSLAEYDTRTFPRDCKITSNGRECVENVRMYAEKVIIHPQYEEQYLSNDISLIRLKGTAPYTQYIRPICLPTINIESRDFRSPQFAVAGWGRIGEYSTNIKQATVLNLVNREVCKKDYSYITLGHLCAAGNSGEDSCKGDSGGPLMILYKGSYYVSGIVSGKRSDFKCGSSMPSLYTNVYHYLDWIQNNIKM